MRSVLRRELAEELSIPVGHSCSAEITAQQIRPGGVKLVFKQGDVRVPREYRDFETVGFRPGDFVICPEGCIAREQRQQHLFEGVYAGLAFGGAVQLFRCFVWEH